MKTIKIFLASSEELDNDRMAFGNLVRRLDDMYEKRGIRIKLFEWEDYDSAFNDRRKQDEYNDYVRNSDIFLALFHKRAGKFTLEEFDVASEEFKKHASPKVYTYCKDLQPDEVESTELAEFKKRLFDEMGHYWCRYDCRESLQLQFVMQLQLVESSQMNDLKVENGEVSLDGLRIAKIDKLKFAAANEDYVKAQQELNELHDEIEEMQLSLEKKQQKKEKKKAKLEKDPDDEDYQDEYLEVKEDVDKLIDKLQPKLNKYNKLKEEFAEYQTLLFNTAKRVAQLQGERITERMRRAMDAFNEGKVREANIILDEAEADARKNLEDYKQSKEITELKRQAVISSIDELLLKTSTIMADATVPIEERIERTEEVYVQADEMAQEIELDKKKHLVLLDKYAKHLYNYAKYDKAIELCDREIAMSEDLYGEEHPHTANSFNNIGWVYGCLGDYTKALEYYQKSIEIRVRVFGEEHPDTATNYNNIGWVYENRRDYIKALEYYQKSIEIRRRVLGEEHPDTADTYNNIGWVYCLCGDYQKALEYSQKSLEICERVLGEEHCNTANSYDNIGRIYSGLGNYTKSLEYYQKSLEIRGRILGKEHPDTADTYNKIGEVFRRLGDYEHALDYAIKALPIHVAAFGENHIFTSSCHDSIALAYRGLKQYDKALEHFRKALKIRRSKPTSEEDAIQQSQKYIVETEKMIEDE